MAHTMSKKVFIKTFGCQMNEYDSDKMADVLNAAQGYEPTDNPDEADLILFNTDHPAVQAMEAAMTSDRAKAELYAKILYDQALLIAGLPLEDPSEYTDLVAELMK